MRVCLYYIDVLVFVYEIKLMKMKKKKEKRNDFSAITRVVISKLPKISGSRYCKLSDVQMKCIDILLRNQVQLFLNCNEEIFSCFNQSMDACHIFSKFLDEEKFQKLRSNYFLPHIVIPLTKWLGLFQPFFACFSITELIRTSLGSRGTQKLCMCV